MLISFILPCYNEAHRLNFSFNLLNKYFSKVSYDFEIIFVDDWSIDNTFEKLKLYKKNSEFDIETIRYKPNKGKWYAVKKWMKKAKWDFVFMMDADIATDLLEIDKFLQIKDKYDIIIWSRRNKFIKISYTKKILSKLSSWLINTILHLPVEDSQCWFKMFNKKSLELFWLQKIDWFWFDFEILYLAKKQWFKIKEIPILWEERKKGKITIRSYITTFFQLLNIKIIH